MEAQAKPVAVVTGAARGIGEAIALRLAAEGNHVVLVARSQPALELVAEKITAAGGSATPFPCDLTGTDGVTQLSLLVENRFSRCDILVNNAGIGHIGKPLHEMSVHDFDETMALNLRAPFLLVRALVPLIINTAKSTSHAHIINISSLAGRNPLPKGAAYAASKWGLNGLTYSLAEELREYGIRVSVVAPGSVDTGFGSGGSGKEGSRKLAPADVAHAVSMLTAEGPRSFISEVLLRPITK